MKGKKVTMYILNCGCRSFEDKVGNTTTFYYDKEGCEFHSIKNILKSKLNILFE